MIRKPLVAVAGLALSACFLVHCGGSSPAQPQTPPTPTPTPPPPTPPPLAYSVIPACPLPASNPGPAANCTAPQSRLINDVNTAIDKIVNIRTDLFDYNDVQGGPKIKDLEKYMTAVVSALAEGGLCGHIDPEGEIGVKLNNSFSEQWIIASKAGYNPPQGNWVRRKYVGACAPSTF